jgi:EAL domain-containing protein (putative c-di-GMP-specific phosphodiesterase class I)
MYKPKPTTASNDLRPDGASPERRALRGRIRQDPDGGRFFLLFQPIVSAREEKVVGAEGLARWRAADGTIIPPGRFVPLAERSGAITALTARLLKEACAFIRSSAHAGKPVIPISLNVSSVQCGDPSFALRLIAAIENFQVPPAVINIEINESPNQPDPVMLRDNLRLLKRYGVGIHIDDFGTGYSSLSLLHELPIDAVKIDKSFIADIGKPHGSDAIVQAIVGLSGKLGFATIAEGVETAAQVAQLKELGVDALQGFFFSRPIAQADLLARLDAENPASSRAVLVA